MATVENDSTQFIQPASLVLLLMVLSCVGIGVWQLYAAANTQPRPVPPLDAFAWLGVAVIVLLIERFDFVPARGRLVSTLRDRVDLRLMLAAVINVAGVTVVATSITVPASFLVAVWCFGLTLFVGAFIRRSDIAMLRRLVREPATWALCGFVLVAVFVRWRNLGNLPWPMSIDEGEMALEAARFIRGEAGSPFDTDQLQYPNIFFYLQSLGIRLFGWNLLAVRIVSAVAGALTVLPVFLLADELFDRITAWTAAVLLLVLPFHVHFSRIGISAVVDLLIATTALWALLRATRTRWPFWWALAGVLLGVGLYFHMTVPFALLLAVLWIILTIRLAPDEWADQWSNLIWLSAGSILGVAPLLRGAQNAADVVFRTVYQPDIIRSGVLFSPEHNTLAVFLRRTYRAALGFFALGDSTYFYGPARPLLDVLSRLLALLGLGRLLAIGYDRRVLWIGAWFGGTALIDGLLHAPPTSVGLVFAIPAMVIVVALGIVWLANCLLALFGPDEVVLKIALPALVVAVIALLNMSFYFTTYLPNSYYGNQNMEVASEAGRLIAEQSDDPYVYFYGAPRVFFGHASLQFLGRIPEGQDGPTPPGDFSFVTKDRSALFVFLPEHAEALNAFRNRYPTIDLHTVSGRTGELLFLWARVSG